MLAATYRSRVIFFHDSDQFFVQTDANKVHVPTLLLSEVTVCVCVRACVVEREREMKKLKHFSVTFFGKKVWVSVSRFLLVFHFESITSICQKRRNSIAGRWRSEKKRSWQKKTENEKKERKRRKKERKSINCRT